MCKETSKLLKTFRTEATIINQKNPSQILSKIEMALIVVLDYRDVVGLWEDQKDYKKYLLIY